MEVHNCPQKSLNMQDAVAANNDGVTYAASKKDLSRALALFREALVGIKATRFGGAQTADHRFPILLDEDVTHRSSIATLFASRGSHPAMHCLKDHVLEAIAGAIPPSGSLFSMSSSPLVGPVFCRPFSIPEPFLARDNAESPPFYFCFERRVDDSLLCAIILFNLAVSTHAMLILGFEHDEHEEVTAFHAQAGGVRIRAISLYRSCAELMIIACRQIEHAMLLSSAYANERSEEPVSPRVPNIIFAWMDVMRMTLLNNQAQLELEHCNHELAYVSIVPVLELASNVLSSSQERYGDQSLSTAVKEMANFLLDAYASTDSWVGCAASA